MKKILLVIFLCSALFSKSTQLSSIALPYSIFINLDDLQCKEECLEDLLLQEKYFSFLAHYDSNIQNDNIKNEYYSLSNIFNINSTNFISFNVNATNDQENAYIKLAILVPEKIIRHYSITSVNSVISYLLSKNASFDIQVFNTKDESQTSMSIALENIKRLGYNIIIAPVTPQGAEFLAQNANNFLVFIPTIHSSLITNKSNNLIYGGINYDEQIKLLTRYANQRVAIFSDGSLLGTQLDDMVKQNVYVDYENEITNTNIDLKSMLKNNKNLNLASIFLNLPLDKTSLLSSLLRVYEINAYSLLSTQINYHPMLLALTQYDDRKKMYLANSIQDAPQNIRAINEIFGHSITYDWVNYSTNIGIDYIYTHYFAPNIKRVFTEALDENQIIYKTSIMRPTRYGFELVGE